MRVGTALMFASALTLSASAASATMRISDDIGGRIGTYVDQYSAVRASGERVVIDGVCLSACTLVLGIVPRNRICVTRRAMLGFHAAWMPGPQGRPVPSEVGTQALWDMYPPNIRRWISARGGLSSKMMFLRGRELLAMYPECRGNGWARDEARSSRRTTRATSRKPQPGPSGPEFAKTSGRERGQQ